MALQLGALRDALVEAGASSEKANRAAEELAGYEREFAGVREAVGKARTDLGAEIVALKAGDIADMKADLRVLKWGQGVTFAAVLAILLKLFIH